MCEWLFVMSVSTDVEVVADPCKYCAMNERRSGVCSANTRFRQSAPNMPQASNVFGGRFKYLPYRYDRIPFGPVNFPLNRWFLEGRHTLTASVLSNYPQLLQLCLLLIVELQLCKPEAALVRRSPGWRSTKKGSNHLIWDVKIAQ